MKPYFREKLFFRNFFLDFFYNKEKSGSVFLFVKNMKLTNHPQNEILKFQGEEKFGEEFIDKIIGGNTRVTQDDIKFLLQTNLDFAGRIGERIGSPLDDMTEETKKEIEAAKNLFKGTPHVYSSQIPQQKTGMEHRTIA